MSGEYKVVGRWKSDHLHRDVQLVR